MTDPWPGEYCKACGRPYKYCYGIPDELWAEITGWKNGEGLLCIDCLDGMAREKGYLFFWGCKEIEFGREKWKNLSN